MKVITCYETEDGSIFRTTYEAEMHERRKKRKANLLRYVQRGGDCVIDGKVLHEEELATWLNTHGDALLEILE